MSDSNRITAADGRDWMLRCVEVSDKLVKARRERDELVSIVRQLAEATTDVAVAGVQHVAREWVARQEAE